jgi:hypothetical protein
MQCPNCGESFERLGMHWYHRTCPYPKIDEQTEEMLVGLLMGDGSIPDRDANELFHLPMINRRFLNWFDDQMGVLTTGVSLKKTAAELASKNRASGFSPNARRENYHDMHTVWSRTHPIFNELHEWYEDGRKWFPSDLELTPTVAEFWYVCDGYLDVGRWGRPRIEIKTRNERERADFLVGLFEDVGFAPTYRRHELQFTCDETEALINWIGDPPPGFEYKWELDSIKRYHELKERAYEQYTTQTLDERDGNTDDREN